MIEIIKRWGAIGILIWLSIFFIGNAVMLIMGGFYIGALLFLPVIGFLRGIHYVYHNWW